MSKTKEFLNRDEKKIIKTNFRIRANSIRNSENSMALSAASPEFKLKNLDNTDSIETDKDSLSDAQHPDGNHDPDLAVREQRSEEDDDGNFSDPFDDKYRFSQKGQELTSMPSYNKPYERKKIDKVAEPEKPKSDEGTGGKKKVMDGIEAHPYRFS